MKSDLTKNIIHLTDFYFPFFLSKGTQFLELPVFSLSFIQLCYGKVMFRAVGYLVMICVYRETQRLFVGMLYVLRWSKTVQLE